MKKRLYSMGVMLLCSLLSFAQFSGSGLGTENDPYLILNPIQLNQMRNYLNQEGVYFKLMANIDLAEFIEDEWPGQGWMPIGTSSTPFKGILNGNGKSITGLWLKRSDYAGLFAKTNGATISNLTLEAKVEGGNNVGAFVGSGISTTISGCRVSGEVKGNNRVGGFAGDESVTFSSCESTANVTATGQYCGGLIGYSSSNISWSSSTDNTIIGTYYVGGLAGYAINQDFQKCYYIGKIVGISYVGGLVGYKYAIGGGNGPKSTEYNEWYEYKISNSFAISDIQSSGSHVGGIVGMVFSSYNYFKSSNGNYNTNHYGTHSFSNCFFSGSIVGKQYVGGLVGDYSANVDAYDHRNLYLFKLLESYSNASIVGENEIGGLCGQITTGMSLKFCTAINTSVHATVCDVGRIYGINNGGIVGEMGTTTENKAWNRTVIMKSGVAQEITDGEQHGTGASETTLKLKATYVGAGWPFDSDNWAIQETECFPYMGWQTAPPVITSNLVANATTISGKCIDGGTVTLEIDGNKQQTMSSGQNWTFTVSPLQAGHEVRISAKASNKAPSYYTVQTVSYAGSGTEEDPYRVYTADDLTGVYRKGYYKLMNDIDLTEWIQTNSPSEGWIAVGREGNSMSQFDGNGHKITGLWTNTNRDYMGLFSMFSNGTIKNLTVETAKGKRVKGGNYTGVLIGQNSNGKILNCTVKGDVLGTLNVGGVIGLSKKNEISGVVFSGAVTSFSNNAIIGGIVGSSDGDDIKNCKAETNIQVSASVIAGGLAGRANSTISQCQTSGILVADTETARIGGIVGQSNSNGIITDCMSSVQVQSTYSAAGIVSYNYGVVERCLASGDLYSKNYAAGIIGYNDGSKSKVSCCVAANNKIEIEYESQQVEQGGGYGQRIIGGIKNGAPAPDDELDNLALKTMQVSVNNVPQKVYDDIMNGKGVEKTELMLKYAYELLGWDFTNTWDIDTGVGTPYLRNVGKVDSGGSPEDNPDDPVNPDADTDNVLTLNNVYAAPGQQVVMPIGMKNSAEITAIQFDLYLPNGVNIATDEDGDLLIDLGDRTTMRKHSVAYRQQTDGAMKVVCSSNANAVFSGNSGTVMTITLNVSADMADGDYALLLKNIELSDNTGTAHNPANVKATLGVSSYTLGDVDGNGTVSINDGVCIVNHILGAPNVTFIEAAADLDGSGTISINDKVVLINDYILGSNGTRRQAKGSNGINELDDVDYLYIEDIQMQPGETREIEVLMQTNRTDIKALQCDIYLPEGMEFVYEEEDGVRYYCNTGGRAARSHTVDARIQGDGALRVVESNDNNTSFKQNDKALFTFTIRASSNMTTGNYAIRLANVELSYGQAINPADRESKLVVGNGKSADVNGDGTVDVADIATVIDVMASGSGDANPLQQAADVNGDGVVDVADIATIIDIMAANSRQERQNIE